MPILSTRINAIKPSPTLQITAKAMELKRQGLPIISLSAGEPDFPTPEHIKEAGIKAIRDNKTRYTELQGIPELRAAICDKLMRDHGLTYTSDCLSVTSGAKQAIYNLMGAVLNPGDEVLIPAPYWVSYPDMAILFEAKPVFVMGDPTNRFKMSPEALERAITPKSKLLILNSPSNPTGVIYTHQELVALGEVLKKHPQVLICSDDIYEKVLWEGSFSNIPMATPELKDRTIVVNGVSKAYAMTGWRIGYAAGDKTIIGAMNKLQSQSTSNACTISQYASLAALTGDQSCLTPMVAAFQARHDYLYTELNRISGMSMLRAEGAFYAFVDVRGLMKRFGFSNDLQLSDLLLDKIHVAGVPGSAFGMDGFIRFSFATSMDELTAVVSRLQSLSG